MRNLIFHKPSTNKNSMEQDKPSPNLSYVIAVKIFILIDEQLELQQNNLAIVPQHLLSDHPFQ
jgi:hypothetical protein